MSRNKPSKMHWWRSGDKSTRCGRTSVELSTENMDDVTCSQCRGPNKPIFYAGTPGIGGHRIGGHRYRMPRHGLEV